MKTVIEIGKSFLSAVLIVSIFFCLPLESLAQTPTNRSNLLDSGSQLVLSVNEDFKADNKADTGTINAVVQSDVYSADGSRILIKSGTPAFIEFTVDSNGAWGKAGKVCLTNAYTKAVDNKKVSLRLSSCKNGGSKLGGVIVLSVLFFPLGLLSGFMKGSMPKLQRGTTFNASVMQDILID